MTVTILIGDCLHHLRALPSQSVQSCVTSPPYFGLRDYGHNGQMGLEAAPHDYIANMVNVFREVRRVLKDDGTLWLNLGDSYITPSTGNSERTRPTKMTGGISTQLTAGKRPDKKPAGSLKQKDLIGIPWRVAFALQDDGWYLRQDIVWHKPNPMPESVRDRCTKAHEYIFMLTKNARYFYDADAIAEAAIYSGLTGQTASGLKDAKIFNGKHSDKQGGHSRRHAGFNERWDAMTKEEQCSGTRNKRSVWSIATKPFAEAHFATFPPELPEICIKAGSKKGDTILDPFGGAGTTGLVADRLQRSAILIELNPSYAGIAERRILGDAPLFGEVA